MALFLFFVQQTNHPNHPFLNTKSPIPWAISLSLLFSSFTHNVHLSTMNPGDYTILFGIGIVMAFCDAFGIGANDVANSFVTSVGSGSITLVQALIIACFCEFGGAFFLGANTTEAIKGGIVQPSMYADTPELLMVCIMFFFSTTHAIVGAITGAGISAFGLKGVQWNGIATIVLSWVVSPVASGVVCAMFFLFTKHFVLKHHDSFRRGLIAIPVYFGVALTVQVFYIIFKGAPKPDLRKACIGIPIGIAVSVGLAVFLWCFFFPRPYLRRKIQDDEDLKWYHVFYTPMVSERVKPALHQEEIAEKDGSRIAIADGQADPSLVQLEKEDKSFTQRMKAKVLSGLNHDINETQDETTLAAHEHATKFDPQTERLFSAVQVVTACFTSFAHGSYDVANAIGPLATIYHVWVHASVDLKKTAVPIWILILGGAAIDIGLMTYGYHVVKTLGNKITYMSPTRGFSAEMATSITILTCSKLKLLVSSTHCVTGATASIGLLSGGGFRSLNCRALLIVFGGWIVILPAAGLISGLVFAFAARSPSM